MKFELLFFDGCASREAGLENLKAALQLEGIPPKVDFVRIKDDTDAARMKFLGSPSFRVYGNELWPEERSTYGLSCHLYQTADGMKGWPSVSMLRLRLRDLVKGNSHF